MNEPDYYARANRIPEPIRRIADNNPLVHRLCDEFIHGNIITFEEALCQMVVLLSRDWDKHQQEAFKLAMLAMPPIIIKAEDYRAVLAKGKP